MIAGSLGGRRLKAPRGTDTRPTAERVREALFAMLGSIDGAVVLDLFAGSGALGIEALSRGAARAVFVERDARALRALRENLAALALGDSVAEVRRAEATGALRAARERAERYDLILLDPPYAGAAALAPQLAATLPALLAPGARVVVERDRRMAVDLDLGVERERRYGDTSITIHRQR